MFLFNELEMVRLLGKMGCVLDHAYLIIRNKAQWTYPFIAILPDSVLVPLCTV